MRRRPWPGGGDEIRDQRGSAGISENEEEESASPANSTKQNIGPSAEKRMNTELLRQGGALTWR